VHYLDNTVVDYMIKRENKFISVHETKRVSG